MHKNNFDFLRLLFACLVIITHSYSLSGLEEQDWLYDLTNGQTLFSYIAVRGFFIISGYLIYTSLIRSKSLVDYFFKRILRLYPALFVVLFFTVLLGSFIYEGPIEDYIKNKTVWTYIPNNLNIFKLQHKIDGVFETNPYTGFINGSLWTITYEVFCYIALSCLFFTKRKTQKLILFLSFTVCVAGKLFFFAKIQNYGLYTISLFYLDLFIYFIAGSFLAAVNIEGMKHKSLLFFIATIALIASFVLDVFNELQFFTFPLVVILFGIGSTRYINNINKRIGDISYGIYIYSFAIQQSLMYFFGFNYLELMLYSFLLSLLLGYLSWHLVEKKALRFKNLLQVQNKIKDRVEALNAGK